MCGSTTETTQQSTYAPLSSRGESYDSLFTQMMITQLQDYGGYDINQVEKTKYQDEQKAGSLQAQISELEGRLEAARAAEAQAQASAPAATRGAGGRIGFGGAGVTGGGFGLGKGAGGSDVASIQRELDGKRDELSKIPQVTYNDFELKKQEDPRVLQAIQQYGPNAPQVQEIRNQLQSDKVNKLVMQTDIEQTFLKNVQKFTKGDYSYTPEQADQVNKFIAPIKGVIDASTDKLLTMADQNGADLRLALNDLATQIDKTGFDTMDALKAAEVQYTQSGDTLMESVRKANESSYNRAKFQFDLLSQEADQKAAQQGALLGLPPGSMTEKVMAGKIKTDALKMLELESAERDANAAFQVQGMTEQGKQKIALSRVALAESQGGKKESLGQAQYNLTSAIGNQKLGLEGARGDALLALEQARQSELKNLALGGLPSMISAGSGALGFMQNMTGAKQNAAAALMAPVAGQLGIEQQRQANEATTTSKTTTHKGFLDAFTDILGGAAGAAGAVMGGIGAMGGGGGGGGGATAPQMLASPAPIQLSYPGGGGGYNLGNYGNQLGFNLGGF